MAPSSPATAAIAIHDLVKRYGDLTAVDGVSFDVAEGDFFGFLGPNGAGKTSTIHCLVGLAAVTSGQVSVLGHDVVRDYRKARRLIGLSPQEFNFDRYLTIRETLIYSAGYFGIPVRECRARADDLLRRFDLWDKRDQNFTKLSGGMKRRLSIARALIHQPRVLVLDEPTAGVDVELRLELWQFLRSANLEGLTIFLTTHYLEEAEKLCNRIGIIDRGRIVALEDKASLMARLAGHTLTVTYAVPPPEPLPGAPPGALPGALPGASPGASPVAGLSIEREAGGTRLRAVGVAPADMPAVLASLAGLGQVVDVHIDRNSLQDIFLDLTGRQLSLAEVGGETEGPEA